MANITKWFGRAIYITALDNFEEINKEIIPLINKEITPTNIQYARTTDIKPNELQSINDGIHLDKRFKKLFDALQPKIIEIFRKISSYSSFSIGRTCSEAISLISSPCFSKNSFARRYFSSRRLLKIKKFNHISKNEYVNITLLASGPYSLIMQKAPNMKKKASLIGTHVSK